MQGQKISATDMNIDAPALPYYFRRVIPGILASLSAITLSILGHKAAVTLNCCHVDLELSQSHMGDTENGIELGLPLY